MSKNLNYNPFLDGKQKRHIKAKLNDDKSSCIKMKTSVITTLQMFTDKGLINYYFCMLLLHMKMCKLFKGY